MNAGAFRLAFVVGILANEALEEIVAKGNLS